MPATRPGRWSGSRTWRGTRSAARPCGGPARSPRPGSRRWPRAVAASSAGRRSSSTGRSGWPAAPGPSAPSRRWPRPRPSSRTRQKSAAPKVEALYSALSEGKWPAILSAAEAVLAVVPEHPAARQARSRAWQQIAAISPAAAGQWPARAARGAPAQPAANEPAAAPDRDRPEAAAARPPEADGIFWLGGEASSAIGPARGRPLPAAHGTGPPAGRRPRASRRSRPARWPAASRPPAPRAASSSGSTASAATSSAWTTGSSSAGPAPTATPISR